MAERKIDLNKIIKLNRKGMTYKEIAAELGTTEQCIKNAVYRAKMPGVNSSSRRSAAAIERDIAAARIMEEERRAEKTEAALAKLDEMKSRCENSQISAMAKDNKGRAGAVNMFLSECIRIQSFVYPESIDTLYGGFEAYIKLCTVYDVPLTMATVCFALGITSKMLYDWKSGRTRTEEYKAFAESVYYAIQAGVEACMAAGVINPVVGIWWEKAHFRMIEAQNAQATEDDPLGQRNGGINVSRRAAAGKNHSFQL